MKKIRLIIWREFITRVRKPSFLIMTILGPLLIGGGVILLFWLGLSESGDQHVLVVDRAHIFQGRLADKESLSFTVEEAPPSDSAGLKSLWPDSVFNASPYTILVEVNEFVLETNTVLLYYKQTPSMTTQNLISKELEKVIEREKLRVNNIEPEAYAKIKTALNVRLFDIAKGDKESVENIKAGIGFFFGYIMFFFVFMYGVQVMRGVMEEKQNRIVEVLISTVKPFQLMMGKIIGIAMVGLVQFLLWILLSGALVAGGTALLMKGRTAEMQQQLMEQSGGALPVQVGGVDQQLGTIATLIDDKKAAQAFSEVMADLPLILLIFLFYFMAGYLFNASLFAAIGSAVDSETDSQQFMLPITIPTIFGIFIAQMAIQNPASPMVFWGSMIPFTSPIVMMVRVAMGDAFEHPGQLVLSMAVMVASFIFTTWLAGRIYRTGILMYGKKVTWRELGKWLFYKG
jgi:ABC-2 type transport system permease protein